jgi:DNA-binding MarR family transcriptional regulator
VDVTQLCTMAYEISLKLRVLREHEKVSAIDEENALSSRELLSCELIYRYSPLSEGVLGRILGVQTTSLHRLVAQLTDKGMIKVDRDTRDRRKKMLTLTTLGNEIFEQAKRGASMRYSYTFGMIDDERELDMFVNVLRKMDKSLGQHVAGIVFPDVHPIEDEDTVTCNRALGLPLWVKIPVNY